MVIYLVEELGADPTLRDGDGLTSADIASGNGMPEVHEYLTKAAGIYKAKPANLTLRNVTVNVMMTDTERDCRDKACFAHSTCTDSLANTGAPLALVGLLERQKWLLGTKMSELAWKGSLPALRRHLNYACDDFWQTRWARMSLHVAAALAAREGHKDFVIHLCKDYVVAINLIAFPVLHVVGTPLMNAIRLLHEDLALQLMGVRGQDLDLERHLDPRKGTLLHIATVVDSCVVVEELLRVGASLDALYDGSALAVVLATMHCHVSVLRVLLREYQTRGRLDKALERSYRNKEGLHQSLVFVCLNELPVEESMRLATTRLLIEEFNADARTLTRRSNHLLMPVHSAAAYGLLSIVKFYILECGLPVDGLPGKKPGVTPLHCAAACVTSKDEEAMLPTIEWLVEKGASLTIQNYVGLTAAQLAAERGKTLVAAYLERRAKTAAIRAEEARQKAEDDLLAELEAEEATARQGGGNKKKNTKKKGKRKDKGAGKVGGDSEGIITDALTAVVGAMSLGEGDRQK